MTRKQDPDKKPELLERILNHLLDKPLSALTFRGLAGAVEVSTFTLVYHFGTRAELVREIIQAIATRQRGFDAVLDPETVTLASYFEGLRHTFELTLLPRNRALQRLEFEAQMIESLEPSGAVTQSSHENLQNRGRDTLISLGLDDADATIESRLLIDTFYGIQVGLVINRDDARATAAFDRAMEQHQQRILTLRAPVPVEATVAP
ncbi:MAG: TetR/AcrR family transcriptional regulator [Lacisediminihabitans sp.]